MADDAGAGSGRRRSRWRLAAWGGAALLLLAPLVAMQLSDDVDWGVADFVLFGALLAGAGGAFELAARRTGSLAYRSAVGIALATAFFLIWVNAAVGIVGSEDHPANLLYHGVIVVGLVGALVARWRPRGMARALAATAFAQALVALIVLLAGWGGDTALGSAMLVAPWLASAWLFRRAAREQAPAA